MHSVWLRLALVVVKQTEQAQKCTAHDIENVDSEERRLCCQRKARTMNCEEVPVLVRSEKEREHCGRLRTLITSC